MSFKMASILSVFLFACASLGCDPPPTDDGDNSAAEVTEDGPADIDDGGISEFPDDPELVEKGEDLFRAEGCAGCHAMERDGAGPALGDVTQRRSPAWMARQIMYPGEMRDSDPEAQALADEYMAPMPATNLEPEQAEALLAYLQAQTE